MDSSLICTRVQAPALADPPETHTSPVETYDRSISNLDSSRRTVLDRVEGRSKPLLKCKHPARFSTFNVNTLGPSGRLDELVTSAKSNAIDIISLQEHRHYHPDLDLKFTKADNFQLVTASAYKNSNNSTIGGVGMLLSPKACENLINIEKIDNRIMVAEFNSNPKLTFISCYSPTNCSDDETITKFYQSLSSVIENVPAHNFLTIAGDLNAKLGPEDVPFTFNTVTNRNGEMLLQIIDEFELFSSTNSFMKKQSKLWSFTYPNGSRAQLDYILFRKKWRNSVHNAQAYPSFSNVGSDHRIVSSSVTLSLRVPRKVPSDPMKQIDWREVSSNKDLSGQYAINVYNKFSELSCPDDTVETRYSNLIAANGEIALSSLPKKPKNKHTQLSSHHHLSSARENCRVCLPNTTQPHLAY